MGGPVNPTICRIQPRFEPYAELTLEGVSPDRVSERLGIPSDIVIKPEVLKQLTESGEEVSAWALYTQGKVRSRRIDDHVSWLLERLSGKEAMFREIASEAEAELRLPGPDRKWVFDKETIARVRRTLGVRIGFMMTAFPVAIVRADDLAYRDVRDADAAGIASLLGELGYPADAAEIPGRLTALRDEPGTIALVAADGEEVVGFVTAHVISALNAATPVAWITGLVVSQNCRFCGIGSELVERVEKWATDRGAERISVTSALHREDAHAFYERKHGYERTGLRFSKDLSEVTHG